jgi:choloylglycine hydrolase
MGFLKSGLLTLLALGTLASLEINACTGIKLKTKNGSNVQGRTLEFGEKIDMSFSVIPRGYQFVGTTPLGPGLAYEAKYAAVGAAAFDNPALLDGINEKGLSVGTFYFPGYAGYKEITSKNQKTALSPVQFSNWLLVSFETLDEIKEALKHVVIAPTIDKSWGSAPPPFHYVVFDRDGNSIVIEPIKGAYEVNDNPLGVCTNAPTFDWHMTNLRNYINLTPFNVSPLQVGSLTLSPFGQGSGMVGMPGDFTPPSRFVRAAIFSITAEPSEDSDGAIFQGFHILHQFDIPVGVALDKFEGVTYSDYTQATVMRDPQTLKYYFTTYDDQTIRMIDLNQFELDAKDIKKFNSGGSSLGYVDISSNLK